MLERCFGWTGLLIEASPTNYAKLLQSGRSAKMVHSAVCPGEDTTVDFEESGGRDQAAGQSSGEPALQQVGGKPKSLWLSQQQERHNRTVVKVPCRSLGRMLDAAGFGAVDVLFLDVEGAEPKALQSVDPARFSAIVMEASNYPKDGGRLKREIEPLLVRAGFRRHRRLELWNGCWNPVYVRDGGLLNSSCIACTDRPGCRRRVLS